MINWDIKFTGWLWLLVIKFSERRSLCDND